MITITRDGTRLSVRIDAAYPLSDKVFVATWDTGVEWAATLLVDHLQKRMHESLAAMRKEAYDAGWKDAKSKKTAKADWHSPMWKS